MYRYRIRKDRNHKFRITGQSKVLKSEYTVNQTWKGLSRALLGYTIVKDKKENDEIVYYSSVIRKLRKELGLPPANFSDLDSDEGITREKEFRK